jgi:hypothetical protein
MLEIQKFALAVLKRLNIDPSSDVFRVQFRCDKYGRFQIRRTREEVQVSRLAPNPETFEFHQSPGSNLWFPTGYEGTTIAFHCCHYLPDRHVVAPSLVKLFTNLQDDFVRAMTGWQEEICAVSMTDPDKRESA